MKTNKLTQTIEKIAFWFTLVVGIFASTLFVLPITTSFVGISKTYLAFGLAVAMMFFYGVITIAKKRIEFVRSSLTWPLLLFGLVVVISTFFTSNYPVENLLGAGGIYLSFVLVALLGGSVLPKRKSYAPVTWGIIIVGLLLTLTGFASLIGLGPEAVLNSWFKLNLPTKSLVFNLSGSVLVAVQVVALAAVAAILGIKDTLKKTNLRTQTILYVMSLSVLALGLGLYIWALFPGKPSSVNFQPPVAGWSVALDSLRVPKSALIGFGPESYINVYQRFKPLWMNGTQNWAVAYIQASIPALTILVTLGFIGLAAWLFLIIKGLKVVFDKTKAATSESKNLAILLAMALALQLFLPINVVVLMITAILIAVYTAAQKIDASILVVEPLIVFSRDQKYLDRRRWPQVLVGVVFIALSLFTGYLIDRSYLAFYHLNKASQAIAANDGVKAYQEMTKVVRLNPYVDTFRRQLALLDLSLATALANKANLTDEEKQQVAQLLQEATNEAKAATILDPIDWRNWQTLAQIYRNMVGVAKDADQWAVQAYIKAIENNPTDPALRIALGGVFLDRQDFQQAANIFSQAINVKPDYANSYYNLAITLKQLGQYEQAKQAYETLLKLLEPDSEDYIKASKELKEVQDKLDEMAKQKSQNQVKEGNQTNQGSIIDQKLNNLNPGELPKEPGLNIPVPTPKSTTTTNPSPTETKQPSTEQPAE